MLRKDSRAKFMKLGKTEDYWFFKVVEEQFLQDLPD